MKRGRGGGQSRGQGLTHSFLEDEECQIFNHMHSSLDAAICCDLHIFRYTYVCACIYIHKYTHIYIYVYIYVYIYIYIYMQSSTIWTVYLRQTKHTYRSHEQTTVHRLDAQENEKTIWRNIPAPMSTLNSQLIMKLRRQVLGPTRLSGC